MRGHDTSNYTLYPHLNEGDTLSTYDLPSAMMQTSNKDTDMTERTIAPHIDTPPSTPWYRHPRLSVHVDSDIGLNASVVRSGLCADMNKAQVSRLSGLTYKTVHELEKKLDKEVDGYGVTVYDLPSGTYALPLYFIPGLTLLETAIFSVIAKTSKAPIDTSMTLARIGEVLGKSTNAVCTTIKTLKEKGLIELTAIDTHTYKKVYAPKS